MAYEVTLITGDGTGPELSEAAKKCVDATGVKINWDVQEAGIDVMARLGTPIPDSTLASIRRTKCALKAPITTPVGKGFRIKPGGRFGILVIPQANRNPGHGALLNPCFTEWPA